MTATMHTRPDALLDGIQGSAGGANPSQFEPTMPAHLEIEVMAGGDPVRFARIASTMVNNTALALFEVLVDERAAYPVPATVVATRGRCVLRLRLRNAGDVLDQLMVEEVVAILSTTCRVVDVHRMR